MAINFPDSPAVNDTHTVGSTTWTWDGTKWTVNAGGAAPVDSVNSQTGVVVLDADDIDDAATTNKFATAAELSKLAGIAAGAEVNVNADWNAVSGDAQILNKPTLGTAAATDSTDYATAAQGALADTALQSVALNDVTDVTITAAATGEVLRYSGTAWVDAQLSYNDLSDQPTIPPAAPVDSVNGQTGVVVLDADDISDAATTNKFATAAELSKLAGIETGATADQTDAEIKTAYENNLDTNAFTDAEKTKLSGITAGAEVNVNADWNAVSGDAQILNKPTIPPAAPVDSVNGQTGAVVLDSDDIAEGVTNLYGKWANATGGINYAGGNVGIGTTTPDVALDINATDAVQMPSGTTAQRPGTPVNGQTRYNSTLGVMEVYVQGQWQVIANTSIDYGLITSAVDTTFDYGALS